MVYGRTDLALEAWEALGEGAGALAGAKAERRQSRGFQVTDVLIESPEASEKLCKPIGRYVTLELDRLLRREDDAFSDCAQALSEILRELWGGLLPEGGAVLVAALGNPSVTPDSVGHAAAGSVLVTRHLAGKGGYSQFRPVALIEPGVLGTTGVESVDVIRAVAQVAEPDLVIAIDALASGSMDRLCRTVQASDTGITPGSGVGNARKALDRDFLGVPVVAVGVPTVVDAASLALDIARSAGAELPEELLSRQRGLIVTPNDIDSLVADIGRLIGYGLNLALQPGLSFDDIDLFIG